MSNTSTATIVAQTDCIAATVNNHPFDNLDSIYLAHASKLHDLSPYVRYNFDEMKSQYSDIVKSYNEMVDQYNEAMDTFCQMFARMQRAKKETRQAMAFIEAQGLIEMFKSKTE